MRILAASFALAAACSGPQKKGDSAIVKEGSDTPTTCCCKTIPVTAEKEIVPSYTMVGRMECSTSNGECVDDVQCNANQPGTTPSKSDGVPPPVAPNTNDSAPAIP